MQKLKVFISSVQKEFAAERELLFRHFLTDALLSSFFEPVMFEKLSANSHAPNKVYLEEVSQSQVYLLLMGVDYGYEDAAGVSPTELEYRHALAHQLDCLAFIKGESTIKRHPKEDAFIGEVQNHLSYKRFESREQLIVEVNKACVTLLKDKGLLQLTSFDESLHPFAQLSDIDDGKVNDFVGIARARRGFPLMPGSPIDKVLTHLHFFHNNKLCNSGLLTFAKSPQQFFPAAVTKCAHFHGLKVEKPIPDHKVFQGDVFEQVGQAADFIMSKLAASVGLRHESVQAPVLYEIPRPVVAEAIVNAIAHRDYNSNGSVQVMLFADRLEIFNPGRLAPELSLAKLKTEHASYPTNPKLAEAMYQAGYIERFGTGTGEILRLSFEAGLKEPEFDFEEGFKVTIWRPIVATDHVTDYDTGQATGQVTGQATGQVTEGTRRVVMVLNGDMKSSEIQEALDLKHRESFRDNYLLPAIEQGLIEMTIPDKPNSPNQKYRLTTQGVELKKIIEKR